MKVFDLFVSKYPPGNDLRKPTAETLEQFQGKVPAELLNFWQEYGFGNYGGGLLKIIDPTDYIDTLTLWLGEQEGCLPILMTGFGTLFIYRKLSDTADDMCLLDIHNRRSGSFSTSFSDFFERIIPAENFAAQFFTANKVKPFLRKANEKGEKKQKKSDRVITLSLYSISSRTRLYSNCSASDSECSISSTRRHTWKACSSLCCMKRRMAAIAALRTW